MCVGAVSDDDVDFEEGVEDVDACGEEVDLVEGSDFEDLDSFVSFGKLVREGGL